ncbi:hypothetical protein ScPMuIL_016819 [Solemya velum]
MRLCPHPSDLGCDKLIINKLVESANSKGSSTYYPVDALLSVHFDASDKRSFSTNSRTIHTRIHTGDRNRICRASQNNCHS